VQDGGSLFTIPLSAIAVASPAGTPVGPANDALEPITESEFAHLVEWVGAGVEHMETIADAPTREAVFALLDGIDTLHRHALGRLLEYLTASGGAGVLARAAEDPMVQTLFEMYDLTVEEPRLQVERALTDAYEYIASHGGTLDLLGVEGGRVRVRLSGACGTCPGSSGTLSRVVEEALRTGYPGFRELVVAEKEPPAPVASPAPVGRRALRRPRWVVVGEMAGFAPGTLRAVWPEGVSILLARLGDEVYAYENGCPPGSMLALQSGHLEGTALVCPWHGCRYDIRTGKRLDNDGKLSVLPVAVHGGEIKVALGTEEIVTDGADDAAPSAEASL